MRWLSLILLLSGCIGGVSQQRFTHTTTTYKNGVIVKMEVIKARNFTFAGPTKASAQAARNLGVSLMSLSGPEIIDMSERIEVQGGEITPEQIGAGVNMLGGVPSLLR